MFKDINLHGKVIEKSRLIMITEFSLAYPLGMRREENPPKERHKNNF